jgi:hypothetical protein
MMRIVVATAVLVFSTSSAPAQSRRQAVKNLRAVLQNASVASVGKLRVELDKRRQACTSPYVTSRTPCVIKAAREACRVTAIGPGCLALADLLAANFAGETAFMTSRERLSLMGSADGPRVAVDRSLRRRYGELAARFLLSYPKPDDQDHAMDEFCRRTGVSLSLAWQHCIGALVWHIDVTSREGAESWRNR